MITVWTIYLRVGTVSICSVLCQIEVESSMPMSLLSVTMLTCLSGAGQRRVLGVGQGTERNMYSVGQLIQSMGPARGEVCILAYRATTHSKRV